MKESLSLKKFKADCELIFDSILSIEMYEFINGTLYQNKACLKLTSMQDSEVFNVTRKFEKHNYLFNALYINLVAILETYLQDRLVEGLQGNKSKIEKLVSEYDLGRKFTAKDVINGPTEIANEILDEVIFHNFKVVNIIYKIVFDTDILRLMSNKKIFEIITVRHKIVHQSGWIGEKRIFVRSFGLLEAMTLVTAWVQAIDAYTTSKTIKKRFPNYLNRHHKAYSKLRESDICKRSRSDVIGRKLSEGDFYSSKKNKRTEHILI